MTYTGRKRGKPKGWNPTEYAQQRIAAVEERNERMKKEAEATGSKVSNKNKLARREALRESLKSSHYLREIHKILEEDYEDNLSLKKAEAKANMYFRLLSKTLPDLKAIELAGQEGEKPVSIQIDLTAKEGK